MEPTNLHSGWLYQRPEGIPVRLIDDDVRTPDGVAMVVYCDVGPDPVTWTCPRAEFQAHYTPLRDSLAVAASRDIEL